MKFCLYSLMLSPFFVFAQQSTDSTIQFNKPQWNKALNHAFLSLLGAKGDNSNIGNYASLDPVGGSVSFKGSIALGKEASTKISYVSFAINGDLTSQSYAALFSDTKLNTNASIQTEWHIRLGSNHFIIDKADKGQYAYNLGLLNQKLMDREAQIDAEKDNAKNRFELLNYQKQTSIPALVTTQSETDRVRAIVDSLFKMYPQAKENDKKTWTDSLNAITINLNKLKKDSTALQFKIDSLGIFLANQTNFGYALDKQALAEYNKNKAVFDTLMPLKKITFNWFTLIAGTGRKQSYSFHSSFPFADQISKNDLTTWKLGVVWNYFDQNTLANKTIYFNFGMVRMRDNNTSLLSTQEISQTKVIVNASKDTTRTISQKYNAYTDSITDYKQWKMYGNFYYLFGDKTSGFHFFPSLYLPDGSKGYLNTGIGYIISFINATKGQPVINAEPYIQFNDVFNSLKLSGTFWNRNEIGIRFSLPISLLAKQ